MARSGPVWITVAAMVAVQLGTTGAVAEPSAVASLALDESAFWDGASPLALATSPLPACTPLDEPCTDFAIDVAEGAARLRVAGDTPGQDGSVNVTLFDSSGAEVTSDMSSYSTEVYAPEPAGGRWYVRMSRLTATSFRMRAKLEQSLPARPTGPEALLPNLRLVPPYEFTFASPLPPVDGRDPVSCKPYEQVEYAAKRCLRFSLGPMNVGDGPLMLRFDVDPITGRLGQSPVTQLVLHGDGTISERPAGTSVWHNTHAHYHHNGFGSLELLEVLDPATGEMTPAGSGPKQGFCMLDFMLPSWTSFENDPPGATRQDCAPVSGDGKVQVGLGTGWGDIYHQSLDGNYVEFGDNTDGRYVIRSMADAYDDIVETDETDNAGYAYVEIAGNVVTVLERGFGTGPWDPSKVVADDLLPPNPR